MFPQRILTAALRLLALFFAVQCYHKLTLLISTEMLVYGDSWWRHALQSSFSTFDRIAPYSLLLFYLLVAAALWRHSMTISYKLLPANGPCDPPATLLRVALIATGIWLLIKQGLLPIVQQIGLLFLGKGILLNADLVLPMLCLGIALLMIFRAEFLAVWLLRAGRRPS